MTEEQQQQQQEHENKRIRPRERALGQKATFTKLISTRCIQNTIYLWLVCSSVKYAWKKGSIIISNPQPLSIAITPENLSN